MKRLNSGQPDRQTERERERGGGGEKIQKIMIDDLSNHFYSFFVCFFFVCLLFVLISVQKHRL